jgi:hypothetical protein
MYLGAETAAIFLQAIYSLSLRIVCFQAHSYFPAVVPLIFLCAVGKTVWTDEYHEKLVVIC